MLELSSYPIIIINRGNHDTQEQLRMAQLKKRKLEELLARQKMTEILGNDDGFWDDDNLKITEEKHVEGVRVVHQMDDHHYDNTPANPYFQSNNNFGKNQVIANSSDKSFDNTNYDYSGKKNYDNYQDSYQMNPSHNQHSSNKKKDYDYQENHKSGVNYGFPSHDNKRNQGRHNY